MDNDCEAALLRRDFEIPLTYFEFCDEKKLISDDPRSRKHYLDYYTAFDGRIKI